MRINITNGATESWVEIEDDRPPTKPEPASGISQPYALAGRNEIRVDLDRTRELGVKFIEIMPDGTTKLHKSGRVMITPDEMNRNFDVLTAQAEKAMSDSTPAEFTSKISKALKKRYPATKDNPLKKASKRRKRKG